MDRGLLMEWRGTYASGPRWKAGMWTELDIGTRELAGVIALRWMMCRFMGSLCLEGNKLQPVKSFLTSESS